MNDRWTGPLGRRPTSGFRGQIIEAATQQAQTGGIDADVWRIMDERDTTLIEEEILNGAQSSKYVYRLEVGGKEQTGISVIGARELAVFYGNIRHRLICSVTKAGAEYMMKSYPHDGHPMDLRVQYIDEHRTSSDRGDYYEVVVEVEDVHTGNRVQVERREYRMEKRSERNLRPGQDPYFERPNYQTIAQSKALRNAILGIIPQHVQLEWKEKQLRLNKTEIITSSVIEERRSGVLRYAAAKAIPVERRALEDLTMDQITGLSDAARDGHEEGFRRAGEALGIIMSREEERPRLAQVVPPPGRSAAPQPPPVQQLEQQTAKVEVSPKPTSPEPRVSADPDFEVYAIDENGEPVVDAADNHLIFVSPVKFAGWLVDQANKTPPDMRQALYAHNADAIADARKDPPAAAILAVLVPEKTEAPKPEQVEQPKDEQPAAQPSAAMQDAHWLAAEMAKVAQPWELNQLIANAAVKAKLDRIRPDAEARAVVDAAEAAAKARFAAAAEALRTPPARTNRPNNR